jgi:hypothetical protein
MTDIDDVASVVGWEMQVVDGRIVAVVVSTTIHCHQH